MSSVPSLRIQVLAASFSPAHLGGATQMGRDLTRGLVRRGHEVCVLTDRTAPGPESDGGVRVLRRLHLEASPEHYRPTDYLLRRRRERENVAELDRCIENGAPDVLLVHAMYNLSRTLPARAEEVLPGRVAYYFPDRWPLNDGLHAAYWKDPATRAVRRPLKRLAARRALASLAREAPPEPRFRRWAAVSRALRDELVAGGLPAEGGGWIHNGIDLEVFAPRETTPARDLPMRVLYAGQLVEHKGVHVLVRALAELAARVCEGVRLTILGDGPRAYRERLRESAARLGIAEHVDFAEAVPRTEMPEVLARHDVLVLPALYEEPLARIVQEAMASGLAVVASAVGGIPEEIDNGRSGLLVPPGDAVALAESLAALARDSARRARLASAGRKRVEACFDLRRTVRQMEALLLEVAETHGPGGTG